MQIKICAVNSKFIHSNLAVHSLACYCKHIDEQINVEVCEFTINDVYKNVLISILSNEPKIIAFSVYIWNIDFISKLCSDIKKISPETVIILGGPEVSFDNADIHDLCDYIIIGEGERAFFCLINELCGNDISNYKKKFGYKNDDKLISCTPIENLSEIPFVYAHTNMNVFKDRIIYYESSRGCPFSCSYCISSRHGHVRYLPLERVYSDIDFFLYQEHAKQVKFVDRTFNSDKNRAYSIFEYIINNAAMSEKNFHFEICADLLDERTLNLLSEAENGLIQFEIGIQTTNEKSLKVCARKTNIEKCFENIKLLLKPQNINIHVDLIAGLPEDTIEDFKAAFNQVYALKAHQFQLGFLKLLKGAPLNSQIEEYGYKFSRSTPYEILTNDNLSYKDLVVLHGVEIALDKFYNSGKFSVSLDYFCDFFDSPYDFYLHLSNHMTKSDVLYRPLSLENLYNILLDFANHNETDVNIDISYFKELLLIDYHSGDTRDNPPQILRDIWQPYKRYKETVPNTNLVDLTARKIGSKYYFFDYSKKNPVTNRYDVKDVII